MIVMIILISLSVSTIFSVLIMKNRSNRWLGMLSACCTNTLILVIAAWFLYSLDDEARLFGLGHSRIYELIFSIPIVIWINFIILAFVRKRELNP